MAREYRIESNGPFERKKAMEMLAKIPYFQNPNKAFQDGEVWLSLFSRSDYSDVRIFPRPYGFFLEISNLPEDLAKSLYLWITELRKLSKFTIIDNDTEEVVDALG